MNNMEASASGDKVEIPPPPEGYDPEKAVIFEFNIAGGATLAWDFQISELHCLSEYEQRSWTRELFELTDILCCIRPATESPDTFAKEIERFPIKVDGELECLDDPCCGVTMEDSVSDIYSFSGPWRMRDKFCATPALLSIGGDNIPAKVLLTNGSWDGLARSVRFYVCDFEVDPLDALNWPFSSDLLPAAYRLFMDADYILHYSSAENKPTCLDQLISDIKSGPGWEILLKMVEQMPNEKRVGIDCPPEDIQRLMRGVNRGRIGDGAAQASLQLF